MLILHYNMHIRGVLYEASEAKPALQASVLQSQSSTLSSNPRDHLWSFSEMGPLQGNSFATWKRVTSFNIKLIASQI